MSGRYRFLFDECLTADLVAVAHSNGYEASHIKFLGRLGASDRSHAVFAVDSDFVFVTNNRKDFLRIYRQFELHPGLIVILPNVARRSQLKLFQAVAERLLTMPDCTNLMVEVDGEGVVTISDWSLTS